MEKPGPTLLDIPQRLQEPYQKISVALYDRQIVALDRAAAEIRERTGQTVSRAELIRTVLDASVGLLNPESSRFDDNVRELLNRWRVFPPS